MGDFFNMDNILSSGNISADDLFNEDNILETQDTPPDNLENNDNKNALTTEILNANVEDIFGSESEEVSSLLLDKGEEEPTNTEGNNSPNDSNFYSSITDALVDELVFQTLSSDDVKKIVSAEDFRDAFEKEINSRLDERNRRINDALNAGVATNDIKLFEGTLNFLNSITSELINEESLRGEEIRRKLIQLSFMNRGYSDEKAIKMTNKLFDSGEDIEEAKEALEENKKHFTEKYNEVINTAKAEEEKYKKEKYKLAEQLKKDILNNSKFFDDVELDKNIRLKVVDNIMRPTYKDPDTGEFLTEIQKYEKENPNDFIKNIGYLYTLTDGFKNLSRLVKPSARKEVKNKLKELEATLSNTSKRATNMRYVSSSNNNSSSNSFFDKGFILDLS